MKKLKNNGKIRKETNFTKRNAKATVFTDLFSIPKYRKQLYMVFHPEDINVNEDDIKLVTLKNILTNGETNDLSFVVRNILLMLYEAQSSWSENMPLRMLEYITESINQYLRDNNILKEYLEERKKEVYKLMRTLFDQEVADEMMREMAYDDGMKCGIQQGIEQGMQLRQNAVNALTDIINKGFMTVEEAAKTLNMSKEQFERLMPV